MLLEGKKAVVTGGTRGIGFALVETFLKNGRSGRGDGQGHRSVWPHRYSGQ